MDKLKMRKLSPFTVNMMLKMRRATDEQNQPERLCSFVFMVTTTVDSNETPADEESQLPVVCVRACVD